MTDTKCQVCVEKASELGIVGTEWKCPKCGKKWIVDFWDVPERQPPPHSEH
jgi:hypothetical protein